MKFTTTVDKAAPAGPRLNNPTKTKSKSMFKIADIIIKIKGYTEFPKPRIKEEIAINPKLKIQPKDNIYI